MKKNTESIFKKNDFIVYYQNFPEKFRSEHRHPQAHLFIPLDHQINVAIEGIDYQVNKGQMLFVPGTIPHSFQAKGRGGERFVLQFASENNQYTLPIGPQIEHYPHLLHTLILQLFSNSFIAIQDDIILLILKILSTTTKSNKNNLMFQMQSKWKSVTDDRCKMILKEFHKNPVQDIQILAQSLGLSIKTMGRLLSQELQTTPKELQTYFRILLACRLLSEKELSLTEISYQCGYQSSSQFISNFKKWTGQRPLQLRKSL